MNGIHIKKKPVFIPLAAYELFSLVLNPAVYAAGIVFEVICFYYFFFFNRFFVPGIGSADMRRFFSVMPVVSVLCIPALTMNLWKKEDELSLLPLSSFMRVSAKWFAAVIIFLFFVLVSLLIPLGASFFTVIDVSSVCTGTIGILLFAMAATALGLCASVLFRRQPLSFFVSALCLAFFAYGNRAFFYSGITSEKNGGILSAALYALGGISRFLSFARHFDSAGKGILDSRDIVFYVCAALCFVYFSAFVLEKRKYSRACTCASKKKLYRSYGAKLLLCALILWNAQVFYIRTDITKNKTYTLSDISTRLLGSLTDTLTVFYYFSPDAEKLYPQVREVKEFLLSYATASSLVSVRFMNTAKDENKRKAEVAHITPRTVQTDSSGSFKTVYSGIALEYQGKSETIPFLLESGTLEFDMTERIQRLSVSPVKTHTVYIAYGGTLNFDEDYPYVKPWLESAGFSVQTLDLDDKNAFKIPQASQNASLLIIGSERISEKQSSDIENFYRSGGHLFCSIGANETDIHTNWQTVPASNTALIRFLRRCGIYIQTALAVDRHTNTIVMANENDHTYESVDYPFFISVLKENCSGTHPAIAALPGLDLFWASPIELILPNEKKENERDLHILASTSDSSHLQYPPYNIDPFDKTLAQASGVLRSAYPIAVCAAEKNILSRTSGTYAENTGKLLVISDQYAFSRMIEYTQNARNLDFLLTGLLWLSGNDDLLALKNRSLQGAAFYQVQANTRKNAFVQNKYTVLAAILVCFAAAYAALCIVIKFKRIKLQKEAEKLLK